MKLSKLVFIGGAAAFSLLSFNMRASEATAKALYAAREKSPRGIQNALDAATEYEKVINANPSMDLGEKSRLVLLEAQALYYAADVETTDGLKKDRFQKASELAFDVGTKLEKPGSPGEATRDEYATLLAKAYYWHGASLARKAEVEGILNSLARWPELKKVMGYIVEMDKNGMIDHAEIEGYGANRVLGRAYFKIPSFLGGDMKKSLELLKAGYEKTLEKTGQASYIGLNNVFYAETLKELGKTAEAKEVLTKFVKMKPVDINPNRIPETVVDQEEAQKLLQKLR